MDGDVRYDHRMIDTWLATKHANGFLMDRDIEPDDKPMKPCGRGGGVTAGNGIPLFPPGMPWDWRRLAHFRIDMNRHRPKDTAMGGRVGAWAGDANQTGNALIAWARRQRGRAS